jgi:hypothetical protein
VSIKTGISLFGWLIYIILASTVLSYVVDRYRDTSDIEWMPLAFIAGFGIVGLLFQFLPDSSWGGGSSDSNTVIPPLDNDSSDGGF